MKNEKLKKELFFKIRAYTLNFFLFSLFFSNCTLEDVDAMRARAEARRVTLYCPSRTCRFWHRLIRWVRNPQPTTASNSVC